MRILILLFFLLNCSEIVAQAQDSLIKSDTFPHYPINDDPEDPTDVGPDLNNSFPVKGALLGNLVPRKWFKWKEDLYDKTGLKLGFSYQTLYQGTSQSSVRTDTSINTGWGGWLLLEGQWKLFNRDKDWEGSITATLDWRHLLGNDNVMPGNLYFETGAMWAHDAQFLPWDPYSALLFWEQHGKKDRFWIRVGQIAPSAILGFFRFKDPRVSFSTPSLTFPLHAVPFSAPGLGAAFKWNPIAESEFYITGAFNDLNSQAGEFNWGTLFDYGEIFAGLEFGHLWKRSRADFDQVHIMFFYADKRSSMPALPTEAGWGFRVHGTKQWNKLVSFANYTFNTVQGGGFGIFTISQQAVNIGLAYNRPLDIQGEIGLAFSWADPIKERAELLGARTEAQYGGELYWKILMLKQLYVTPGIQFTVNPTYNTRVNSMVVFQIKARAFF